MEEIEKSPYRKITKDKKQKLLQERYTAPVYLYAEELQRIISTAVPEALREVQNAFALQCAIGCRVGDFKKLTTANIATAKEGFLRTLFARKDRRRKCGLCRGANPAC